MLDTVFTSAGSVRYLEVVVDNGDGTLNATDTPISPRQRLTSTAYSFRARAADTLANGAVVTSTLAPASVTQAKMADGAVGTSILVDGSVTQAKLVNGAVGTLALGNNAVTAPNLAANSVVTASIVDGSVGTVDLAAGAVTGAKIANGTITGGKIGSDTINAGNIAANAVGSSEIASGAVTAEQFASGSVTLAALAEALQQQLMPVGSVMPYAGDTAPAGWLLCDGASVNQSTHPALYALVGKRFGQGSSATTTFRTPDLRGRFIRGRNDGATGTHRDVNASTRTAMNTGGATGDKIGSMQLDLFKAHVHVMTNSINSWDKGNDSSNGKHEVNFGNRNSNSTGGSETRPVNVSMNYIIKY